MNPKKIISGKESLSKILKGLDIAADAVANTLGPKGKNVNIFYQQDPIRSKITNDGVSIANEIMLKDLEEDAGAFVIRNVSSQMLDDVGDGTTTATVLTQAIIHECIKRPENSMEIRESLKAAGDKVLKMLVKKSTTIKDEDIEKVALISSEDKELARMISEIVKKLGNKAVINVEDSKTFKTDYEIVDGYEAHVGFMSPHFINEKKSSRAKYDDIFVLCSQKKISNIGDISHIFEEFKKQGITSCVIVCEEIDDSVLGIFVNSKMMGTFNGLVIKATGPLLEDIAGMVGAKIISDTTGISFQNFALESLGKAKKVICDANKTIFIGDGVSAKEYAEKLEAAYETEENMYTKQTIEKRLAKLRGGIAVLRISAPTDAERGYLKDKAEDAIKATLAALEEGIVEGGGMTLWRIAEELNPKKLGEQILRNALRQPLRKIIENAGKDYTEIIGNLTEGDGYDAKNNRSCQLIVQGIIDPAKVERCALTNAISAASQLITVQTLIVEDTNDKK